MSKELVLAAEALISEIDTFVLAGKKFNAAKCKRETPEQKERFQQRKKALNSARSRLGEAKRNVRLLVAAPRQPLLTKLRRALFAWLGGAT